MSNTNNGPLTGHEASPQFTDNSQSTKDAAAQSAKAEGQQLKGEAQQSGRRVKETAKDQAVATKDEATHQAQDLLGQLKANVQEYAGPQQERIASTVRSVSDEIQAIQRGDKPESDYVAGLLGSVSGTVDSIASSLEQQNAQDLLGNVRRFAAQRPGTFLAIAAGIGVLAGRATRSARDSDDIPTDRDGVKGYVEGSQSTTGPGQGNRSYTTEAPTQGYQGGDGERR